MPDKIICIGLPKTGTNSILKALKILGYTTKHYPIVKRLEEMMEKFDAVAECGAIIKWKELYEKYDAKCILTTRDLDSWLPSLKNWLLYVNPHPKERTKKVRKQTLGSWNWNRKKHIRKYRRHHRQVKRYFKDNKDLLIMNIINGDGWEKLCRFLDKSIPDVPFPHENKKDYEQKSS